MKDVAVEERIEAPEVVERAQEEPAAEAQLELAGLRKSYGRGSKAVLAVESVELSVAPGEIVVLLGPSGCGKTTTLRCVAGLEEPEAGRISIDGTVVCEPARRKYVAPERRGIGMVFQSYSLWPHMTVRRNIEYPLRVRRNKEGLSSGWAEEAARMVECGELLDRYPSELSGGQQQRIALARGLVARPSLMLFDEPLSNLDSRLRVDLRSEIRALHERIGFSGLYVTHDQEEAIVVGDRIVVMAAGRIEQEGLPEEVFRQPRTSWVAEFLGVTNRAAIEAGAGERFVGGAEAVGALEAWRGAHELRVRPEECFLRPPGQVPDGEVGLVRAEIDSVIYSGLFTEYVVRAGDVLWRVRGGLQGFPSGARLAAGDPCSLVAERTSVLAYDAGGALHGPA